MSGVPGAVRCTSSRASALQWPAGATRLANAAISLVNRSFSSAASMYDSRARSNVSSGDVQLVRTFASRVAFRMYSTIRSRTPLDAFASMGQIPSRVKEIAARIGPHLVAGRERYVPIERRVFDPFRRRGATRLLEPRDEPDRVLIARRRQDICEASHLDASPPTFAHARDRPLDHLAIVGMDRSAAIDVRPIDWKRGDESAYRRRSTSA